METNKKKIINKIMKFKFFKKPKKYPLNKVSQKECINLAKFMHDIYELASQDAGWETNKKCRVSFSKLPKKNQKVMIVVANSVLCALYKTLSESKEKLQWEVNKNE